MKKALILLLLLPTMGVLAQSKEYTASIKAFHKEQNDYFSDPDKTPLTASDLKKFKGHDYFPIDETYRVEAEFIRRPDALPFLMKTSTDRTPTYILYGVARFKLQGKPIELEIYRNLDLMHLPQYKDHLFLPFTDQTNGLDSYGGGRYMEISMPEGNTIVLDFNKTYNPSCAYNARYSCPIPPKANNIQLAIKAGIKLDKHK
jgi:uncharacterized protein (DUF1684 family)